MVENQSLRDRAAAAGGDGPMLGYHPSNTPEKAAALLTRILREQERRERPEPDRDEEGLHLSVD